MKLVAIKYVSVYNAFNIKNIKNCLNWNKYTTFWLEQNKESTTKNENTQNLGMSTKNSIFSFLLWLFISQHKMNISGH